MRLCARTAPKRHKQSQKLTSRSQYRMIDHSYCLQSLWQTTSASWIVSLVQCVLKQRGVEFFAITIVNRFWAIEPYYITLLFSRSILIVDLRRAPWVKASKYQIAYRSCVLSINENIFFCFSWSYYSISFRLPSCTFWRMLHVQCIQ